MANPHETSRSHKIEASAGNGLLQFDKHTQIEPMALVKLVQTQPKQFKLEGSNRLRFTVPMEHYETRFQRVEDLLKLLVK